MEIRHKCGCWEDDTHFRACCEEHHYMFIFDGKLLTEEEIRQRNEI